MGRIYGGTLALLAFGVVMARGIAFSAGVDSTIKQASIALWGAGLLGYILGSVAEAVVEQAITTKVNAEIEAIEKAKSAPAAPKPA